MFLSCRGVSGLGAGWGSEAGCEQPSALDEQVRAGRDQPLSLDGEVSATLGLVGCCEQLPRPAGMVSWCRVAFGGLLPPSHSRVWLTRFRQRGGRLLLAAVAYDAETNRGSPFMALVGSHVSRNVTPDSCYTPNGEAAQHFEGATAASKNVTRSAALVRPQRG